MMQVNPSPLSSSDGMPLAVSGSIPSDATVTNCHFALAETGRPPVEVADARDMGTATMNATATVAARSRFKGNLPLSSGRQAKPSRPCLCIAADAARLADAYETQAQSRA